MRAAHLTPPSPPARRTTSRWATLTQRLASRPASFTLALPRQMRPVVGQQRHNALHNAAPQARQAVLTQPLATRHSTAVHLNRSPPTCTRTSMTVPTPCWPHHPQRRTRLPLCAHRLQPTRLMRRPLLHRCRRNFSKYCPCSATRSLQAAASPPSSAASSSQPPPAPHRSTVLDRVSSSRDLSDLVAAVVDADLSDSEEQEVTSHTHTTTPTAVLPPAFVPTPPGTAQSAQQQLAAIVSSLGKQGAKVKYATAAEFNEALDDWAADSVRAGQTLQQVEAIRAYQRLLILKFLVAERRPLAQVLEYHRKWCKAVHAGSIDMYAPGAELNLAILYDVEHPFTLSHSAGSTAAAGATGKPRKSASSAGSDTKPAAAKHPVGSCTKHPTSTTHTTAECRLK